MKIEITLGDLRNVAALANAASTDKNRPALGGIYIEPEADGNGLVATATDSYILASLMVADAVVVDGESILIPAKELVSALKGAPRTASNKYPFVLTVEDGWLTVAGFDIRTSIRLTDGTFPRWRGLIPDGDGIELAEIVFDPAYLARLAKATPEYGPRMPLRLQFTGEVKLIKVARPGRSDWQGVIMPVRV